MPMQANRCSIRSSGEDRRQFWRNVTRYDQLIDRFSGLKAWIDRDQRIGPETALLIYGPHLLIDFCRTNGREGTGKQRVSVNERFIEFEDIHAANSLTDSPFSKTICWSCGARAAGSVSRPSRRNA